MIKLINYTSTFPENFNMLSKILKTMTHCKLEML
jgi:hypothetical protein